MLIPQTASPTHYAAIQVDCSDEEVQPNPNVTRAHKWFVKYFAVWVALHTVTHNPSSHHAERTQNGEQGASFKSISPLLVLQRHNTVLPVTLKAHDTGKGGDGMGKPSDAGKPIGDKADTGKGGDQGKASDSGDNDENARAKREVVKIGRWNVMNMFRRAGQIIVRAKQMGIKGVFCRTKQVCQNTKKNIESLCQFNAEACEEALLPCGIKMGAWHLLAHIGAMT